MHLQTPSLLLAGQRMDRVRGITNQYGSTFDVLKRVLKLEREGCRAETSASVPSSRSVSGQ